jgi:hypothetical protein
MERIVIAIRMEAPGRARGMRRRREPRGQPHQRGFGWERNYAPSRG